MLPKRTHRFKWWSQIIFMIAATSLVYLIGIRQASYYRDDWYYAYDGYAAGPAIFHQMFSSDRPIRGFFFEAYYNIFESHALPYHLGAYLWRLLGCIGALWLFHILWPKNRSANFAAALLSAIYPGYLWWVAGIEYQPMIASYCIHIISIALTLKAILSRERLEKFTFMAGSILTGWCAIFLVDYAVGMEVFRILCIFLVTSKGHPGARLSQRLYLTVRASIIPLIIPIVFVFWKMFIFKGEREATDIAIQLSVLYHAPLATSLLWAERIWQSFWNVSILAWSIPLQTAFPPLAAQEKLTCVLTSMAVIAVVLYAMTVIRDQDPDVDPNRPSLLPKWQWEAIGLGATGTFFGILPIIMANRYIAFKAFSHYALPPSLAAVLLITGLIYSFNSKSIRLIVLFVLVGISALTHRAVLISSIREQQIVRAFWWQVYWRVPAFQKGTTLAAVYPSINYGKDTDIVWGPANFMYFPEQNPGAEKIRYWLAASPMTDEGIRNVIGGEFQKSANYRSHNMYLNYKRVVVLSQPSTTSCVHVINGQWHETSIHDSPDISAMFPRSKVENVSTEQNIPTPLSFAFGKEPVHDWCYYYEKADLARQKGDWESIRQIGEEADALGFEPQDLVELMPFLEAYAYLGDHEEIEQVAARLNSNEFYTAQACTIQQQLTENGYPLAIETTKLINDLFCQPSQ